MRKADLVQSIHDKTGIPKVDIIVALENFFTEVKHTVFEGEAVSIRGFGTFTVLKRRAKLGRNIKANSTVEIPEHYIPKFKPAKEFVNTIKTLKIS